jgi:hypothetical protein
MDTVPTDMSLRSVSTLLAGEDFPVLFLIGEAVGVAKLVPTAEGLAIISPRFALPTLTLKCIFIALERGIREIVLGTAVFEPLLLTGNVSFPDGAIEALVRAHIVLEPTVPTDQLDCTEIPPRETINVPN